MGRQKSDRLHQFVRGATSPPDDLALTQRGALAERDVPGRLPAGLRERLEYVRHCVGHERESLSDPRGLRLDEQRRAGRHVRCGPFELKPSLIAFDRVVCCLSRSFGQAAGVRYQKNEHPGPNGTRPCNLGDDVVDGPCHSWAVQRLCPPWVDQAPEEHGFRGG